jgi:hypothetical protein
MAEKRLCGEDAEFFHLSLSATLTGDGASTLNVLSGGAVGGYYRITAIAAASTFPAALLTVGYIFWDDGTLVPAVGDNCNLLTPVQDCSISGWSVSMSKGEIDVTTLCDLVTAFRAGKTDMSGSLTGIFTSGFTGTALTMHKPLMSQFITSITDPGGLHAVLTPSDTALWLGLYVDQGAVATDLEEVLFLPVRLTGHDIDASLNAAIGETINFRVDGSLTPVYYSHTMP